MVRLPHQVHAGIERILGCPVAEATNQPDGFSDGLAARLVLGNGRRTFVKAIDAVSFPAVGEFHRREIAHRQPWRICGLAARLDRRKHADLTMLLGSVALSRIDPEPFAERHPLLVQVDPDALNTLISAQSGFLLDRACSSKPNADPHLIRMMIALGLGSLRWLSTRWNKS